VLIHAGAAVIAGIHPAEPIEDVSGVPEAVVMVEVLPDQPQPPEPTPPPEEPEPAPPPPPDIAPPEFHEEQPTPPPVKRPPSTKPVQPIKAPKPVGVPTAQPGAIAGKALMTSKPHIEYPYEARRSKTTGSGVVLMQVNPSSGEVTDVSMSQSTGSPVLDNACIAAFKRARFQPGVGKAKTPITFTLTGASY
jgi:protein TonB